MKDIEVSSSRPVEHCQGKGNLLAGLSYPLFVYNMNLYKVYSSSVIEVNFIVSIKILRSKNQSKQQYKITFAKRIRKTSSKH